MINENLPHGELIAGLEEYVDRIDYVLSELGISPDRSIMDNRKLLGRLHHAANIANYGKSEFRERLLRRAGKKKLEIFLRKTSLANSLDNVTEMAMLIRTAARLPWGNNEHTRTFVDVFGYEEGLVPREMGDIPSYEACASYGDPLKTLKKYQAGIFFESMGLVTIPWSRFIVKMPTGAGKTRTAMETVCHFLRDDSGAGFQQVLWIADRDELCEQAIESVKHVWPHIGGKTLNIYRFWGSRRHDEFKDPAFIVATYQTLRNVVGEKESDLEPDLIVTDEAHNVLAPTHKQTLDHLIKKRTRVMGLTATPVRAGDSESAKLIEFFHDRILEIDSGDTNTIEYLQGLGYLSDCEPVSIQSHREYRLTMKERKEIERDRDLPPGLLDKIAQDDHRNIIIAEHLQKLHDKKKQVLYFAPSIGQSKFMCMVLMAMAPKRPTSTATLLPHTEGMLYPSSGEVL